jgi:hypothetical protein
MIIGDSSTKTQFADQARSAATSFIQSLERLIDLQTTYIARGYVTGGADAIIDADIVNSKITAAQLNNLLNSAWLVSRISTLMNQGTVSGTIDGNSIIDVIRADM